MWSQPSPRETCTWFSTISTSTRTKAARHWLQRHPRVHFHYTPAHASWVNLVECFFSILGRQGLAQSVHTSKRQLKEFLLDFIARNNENPRPFVRTK